MTKKSILSLGENSSLNGGPDGFPGGQQAFDAFVQSLLKKYADNPTALEYIRVYTDPDYLQKVREYRDAFILRDTQKIARCETWFHIHYPTLSSIDFNDVSATTPSIPVALVFLRKITNLLRFT